MYFSTYCNISSRKYSLAIATCRCNEHSRTWFNPFIPHPEVPLMSVYKQGSHIQAVHREITIKYIYTSFCLHTLHIHSSCPSPSYLCRENFFWKFPPACRTLTSDFSSSDQYRYAHQNTCNHDTCHITTENTTQISMLFLAAHLIYGHTTCSFNIMIIHS